MDKIFLCNFSLPHLCMFRMISTLLGSFSSVYVGVHTDLPWGPQRLATRLDVTLAAFIKVSNLHPPKWVKNGPLVHKQGSRHDTATWEASLNTLSR